MPVGRMKYLSVANKAMTYILFNRMRNDLSFEHQLSILFTACKTISDIFLFSYLINDLESIDYVNTHFYSLPATLK